MDKIFASWLEVQHEQGRALEDDSDIVELIRVDSQRFATRFHCRGLVQGADGQVRDAGRFEVGYWFSDSYLRHVEPLDVLTWIAPRDVFHPNIRFPKCCIGPIAPGTSLIDLIYRVYEVISYQNVMPDERDALNLAACSWARHHQACFPVDDHPLKRRRPGFRVEELEISP